MSEKKLIQYVITPFDLTDEVLVQKYTDMQDGENKHNFPRSLREHIAGGFENTFIFVVYAHITTTRSLITDALLDIPEETDLQIVGFGDIFTSSRSGLLEITYTIRDDFQGRGLGEILAEHLLYQVGQQQKGCFVKVGTNNVLSIRIMEKLARKHNATKVTDDPAETEYVIAHTDLPTSHSDKGSYELRPR